MAQSAEAREKDRKFMQNPNQWPNWPVLPVKRYTPGAVGPGCGFILAVENHMTVVFDGMIFDPRATEAATGAIQARDLSTVPHHKYDDVDALLDDGWMVD